MTQPEPEAPAPPLPPTLPFDVLASADGLPGFLLSQPPFDLEAGALIEESVTWRRKQVTNPHVEGTYTVHAERENSEIPLNVWCEGATPRQTRDLVQQMVDLLSRRRFDLTLLHHDGADEVWTCEVSDYVIEQSAAFRYAGVALVKARITKRPGRRVVVA